MHRRDHLLFQSIKRSTADVEALRRADAEAEVAWDRARMLKSKRATKRPSATPLVELEESAMNDDAEKSAEAMLAAVEAVLTETRQTVEARTVSALQQAHAASHRADLTKEGTRKKQLDFLVTCTAASCSQPASSKEVLCRHRGTL